MKILFFLFYLFYKVTVFLLLFSGLQWFSLRVEVGVWIVYGSFSVVAFLFFVGNVLLKKISLFSRWTLWWLVFLEWLALGMTGFYLYFFRESSPTRVLWLVSSFAPLHLFFFDMMRFFISRWSSYYLSNLQKPSWVFEYGLEILFLFSIGFLASEGMKRSSKVLLLWCSGLVGWVLFRHYARGWLWQKHVKKLSYWLLKQNPLLFAQLPPIRDTNTLSPLLFAWQQYVARTKGVQKQLLLISPALSGELQKKLAYDNEITFGVERPATIVTLFWKTKELSPLQEYVFLEAMAKTAMGYVYEYDGFPFWESQRLFVFFGFPYFYEHKNLFAIEFSQRILSEIQLIAREQNINLDVAILILVDTVRIGSVPLLGEDFVQLVPQGKFFSHVDLVRRASEGLSIPLLIDKRALEGLESRFFVHKRYKIAVDDEVLFLCQVVD